MMYGVYIHKELDYADGHSEAMDRELKYPTLAQAKEEFEYQTGKAHNTIGYAKRKGEYDLVFIEINFVEYDGDDVNFTDAKCYNYNKEEQEL